MSAVFVTGTDTGVGKTVVSAWLALHWQAAYWKPIQSGLGEGATDSEWVARWSGQAPFAETYRLRTPASPHLAARLDGQRIRLDAFSLPKAPRLIVEGAGGVMVPLNDEHLMLDLMRRLRLPVLLVARPALGTINHTLLSLRVLRDSGIDVLGVILNGPTSDTTPPIQDTRAAIEHHGRVRVLDVLSPWPHIDRDALLRRPPAPELAQGLQALERA